jgi:hypothetical protein
MMLCLAAKSLLRGEPPSQFSAQKRRLSQVHRMFPTGLVLGVYNNHTKETLLNPPVARRVAEGDMLVMMRPTAVSPEDYKPISEPVPIDLGALLSPLSNNTEEWLIGKVRFILRSLVYYRVFFFYVSGWDRF